MEHVSEAECLSSHLSNSVNALQWKMVAACYSKKTLLQRSQRVTLTRVTVKAEG